MLDSRSALFEPVQSGIAVEALDWMATSVADASVDKERTVCNSSHRLRPKELAHGCFSRDPDTRIPLGSSVIEHGTKGVYVGGHLCKIPLNSLPLTDRPAEG